MLLTRVRWAVLLAPYAAVVSLRRLFPINLRADSFWRPHNLKRFSRYDVDAQLYASLAALSRSLICISLLFVAAPLRVTATTCQSNDEPVTKVRVQRLVVRSPVTFTPSDHQRLMVKLRALGWKLFRNQDSAFAKDTPEELVREAYQDKGYVLAEVSSELLSTRAGANAMVLVVRVAPKRQYRLTGVSWKHATIFSESELAKLIPVRPGELFSRRKIAEGLEAARRLYESRGYINFTSIPTPQIDQQAGTVALVIEIDEGGQFHFGELRVEGMREEHRKILLSAWDGLRGQPYNIEDADKFFLRFFRSPRPNIKPENYTVREIHESNHSVDYSLKFAPFVHYRVGSSSQLEPIENR